jgi:hypothetical protein
MSMYGLAAVTALLVIACSGLLLCLGHSPPHKAGLTDQPAHPPTVRSAALVGLRDGSEAQEVRNSPAESALAASGMDVRLHIMSGTPDPVANDLVRTRVDAVAPPDPKTTPEQPRLAAATRNLSGMDQARAVQQRLAALGFFHASATGVWSSNSRQALAAFKAQARLSGDDVWDEATERSLFGAELPPTSFVGQWAPTAQACTPQLKRGGLLSATINEQGAWAGETTCRFQRRKQAGTIWTMVAACSDQRRRWTAHVRLELRGDRLT